MGKVWAKIILLWSPIFISLLVLDFFGLIPGGIYFRNPFLFWISDTFLLVLYLIVALIAIAGSIARLQEPEPIKRGEIKTALLRAHSRIIEKIQGRLLRLLGKEQTRRENTRLTTSRLRDF